MCVVYLFCDLGAIGGNCGGGISLSNVMFQGKINMSTVTPGLAEAQFNSPFARVPLGNGVGDRTSTEIKLKTFPKLTHNASNIR